MPAILDKDLFYRAGKQLENNAWFSNRNKKHDYLLSGLIFCECGSRMCGEGVTGHYYYRCSNRIKRFPLPKDCFASGVNTKRIDGVVWTKVKKLLTNEDLLRKQAKRWLSEKQLNSNNYDETELEILKKKLQKLADEEKRQAKAYGAGVLSFKVFKELMTDLRMKKMAFETQLRKAKTKTERRESRPELTIGEIGKRAPKVIAELLKEEKQMVLRKLVEKIIVDRERRYAKIKGYIPLYLTDGLEAQNYEFQSISRDCRSA